MVMVVAVFSNLNIFVLSGQTTATRQSSIDEFTKGNYEQAYNDFRSLLRKYPKDPLYKYYSGACLVLMKKDPSEALTLLQQSVNGASVVRSLPDDAVFYLGRAQQMSGMFAEAISSYSQYTDQVGKKAAREQDVAGYIQECENKKGMIEDTEVRSTTASAAVIKPETVGKVEPATAGNSATKPAGKEIRGKTPLPQEYEKVLDEALRLQYKADSLNLLAEEQKRQLGNIPEAEQSAQKMKISQNEILAASYQKSADMKYNEAQAKMNPGVDVPLPKTDTIPKAAPREPAHKEETTVVKEAPVKTGTEQKVASVTVRATAIFSQFEVLPGDAAYPDEKIKIDPKLPAGLIYRIQLAVFRNPVAPSVFKGITPVYGLKVPGTDKTNYYAGLFRKSSDAKKALLKVKETGFRDAFIVAQADNKAVSSDRAAVLENEWGSKPLFEETQSTIPADTLPPTLSFRVEVARSLKPMKPDAVETLRSLSGNNGFDIVHLADGNYVYLIGKFITFESAAEYADLLVRNNYRGAKVVAWLGNKEVPVDTARQLFNNL